MRLIDAHVLSAQYKVEYDHADAMGNAHRKKGWQGALQLLYDAPPSTRKALDRRGGGKNTWNLIVLLAETSKLVSTVRVVEFGS